VISRFLGCFRGFGQAVGMQTERRTNRSHVPGEALSLALAAATTREGAHAAVLADADGFLLAGAGLGVDHEWIAALAPAVAELSPIHRERLLERSHGKPLHVAPITVQGSRMFLASLGASLSDVARVEAAAHRILAA